MENFKPFKKIRHWGLMALGCVVGILNPMCAENVEASKGLGGPSHIGTFEGSTTFTTSSSNGINPGLYLEVMDKYGNSTEYTSEEGVITIPNTQEGAYITQAKLLGKTKYRDQDTGELLDQWEAGRNLTLESVEKPALTTVGKNLLEWQKLFTNELVDGYETNKGKVYVPVRIPVPNVNEQYTLVFSGKIDDFGSDSDFMKAFAVTVYYTDGTTSQKYAINDNTTLTTIKGKIIDRIEISHPFASTKPDYTARIKDIALYQGSVATPYEPYQSNLLTVKEDVELRGVGDVRDMLDLVKSEVTERVGEMVFDGSENWVISQYTRPNHLRLYFTGSKFKQYQNVINSRFPDIGNIQGRDVEGVYITNTFDIQVEHSRLSEVSVDGFKQWLSQNPITVKYPLKIESVKTVSLNSTYYFQPVLNRSVEVNGTVLPLVYSVTVPTDPLSFVLNPNAEEGQRFIAPTFTITNDTPASIQIELKAFEQTTNTFRDVLPTKYEDWNQLSKDQSKDFALALLPVPSEGWASLKEGPRYVVDSSNYDLGEIKAESSVDFTFTASHGRAFVERLNPQYRLSFMFGF